MFSSWTTFCASFHVQVGDSIITKLIVLVGINFILMCSKARPIQAGFSSTLGLGQIPCPFKGSCFALANRFKRPHSGAPVIAMTH